MVLFVDADADKEFETSNIREQSVFLSERTHIAEFAEPCSRVRFMLEPR